MEVGWKWATVLSTIMMLATILVGAGQLTETLASHGRRIDAIEQRQQQDHDTLGEIRGDVKLLLERTADNNAHSR